LRKRSARAAAYIGRRRCGAERFDAGRGSGAIEAQRYAAEFDAIVPDGCRTTGESNQELVRAAFFKRKGDRYRGCKR
jgi:hypothetical protein